MNDYQRTKKLLEPILSELKICELNILQDLIGRNQNRNTGDKSFTPAAWAMLSQIVSKLGDIRSVKKAFDETVSEAKKLLVDEECSK